MRSCAPLRPTRKRYQRVPASAFATLAVQRIGVPKGTGESAEAESFTDIAAHGKPRTPAANTHSGSERSDCQAIFLILRWKACLQATGHPSDNIGSAVKLL